MSAVEAVSDPCASALLSYDVMYSTMDQMEFQEVRWPGVRQTAQLPTKVGTGHPSHQAKG